jgi:hypothetical protein
LKTNRGVIPYRVNGNKAEKKMLGHVIVWLRIASIGASGVGLAAGGAESDLRRVKLR